MKRIPVNSSMIASVGYDRQERVLEVEFNTGNVYEYYDVPYREYLNLMKDESKGSYMKTFIIDQYGYGQVSRSRRQKQKEQPPGAGKPDAPRTLRRRLHLVRTRRSGR